MAQKITLRKKLLGSGEKNSLYLDYSPPAPHSKTGEVVRKEYLGLYTWASIKVKERKGRQPKEVFDENPIANELKENHNTDQQRIAETILSRRLNELNKPEVYGKLEQRELEKRKREQKSFVAFFEKQCDHQLLKGQRNYLSALLVYKQFNKGKDISFSQLTPEHCEDFKSYLLLAASNQLLDHNTAAQYFKFFRIAINQAERLEFIDRNPNRKVSGIKLEKREKDFLTTEELEKLARTDCKLPEVKRICLFAAVCGQRRSDILGLTWSNVVEQKDGSLSISFIVQKSRRANVVPLNLSAVQLLGKRGESSERVFKVSVQQISNYLPQWLKAAGINKKITFHNFRHSFISNLLLLGSPITNVSKLAGHSTVTQTLNTYSHLTAEKMRETVEQLNLNFD